jgi:hypothetical protein
MLRDLRLKCHDIFADNFVMFDFSVLLHGNAFHRPDKRLKTLATSQSGLLIVGPYSASFLRVVMKSDISHGDKRIASRL